MIQLALAALFLPISHYGLSSTGLRDALVARLGERGYLALYSIVAFAAFGWLIAAYRSAPFLILWTAPPALDLAMVPIILVAFLLVIVGVTTPNPTTVGEERRFADPNVVRGVLRVTRNPFLWGSTLWAFAHVIATGDAASLLLFGSVGVLGFAGTMLLEAKKARRHGAEWVAFERVTSNVPFAAIAAGRQRLDLGEIGWWRIALALSLFVLVLVFHRWAFGVSPLPV